MNEYILSARSQFEYYKLLGEKTMARLDDEELNWQYNEESNSIAMIVKHMWGNMLSRWTDFLTTDGEKEWRKRDDEFRCDVLNKDELLSKWREGWVCLFNAMEQVNENNFGTIVYIRNQGHSITEAINRQLAHYAYHVGQIVFAGKMLKNTGWDSLSIPRNKSAQFNMDQFSKEKRRENFTEEYLKNERPKTS